MAHNFIGLVMLVTLNSPPGTQVKGIVSGIEPGKSLTLRDVTCLSTGKYTPESTIKASEILELVEAVHDNPKPACADSQCNTKTESKAFEDPAILSVGKRPSATEKYPSNTIENPPLKEQPASPKKTNKTKKNGTKSVSSFITPSSEISLTDESKEYKAQIDKPLNTEVETFSTPKTELRHNRSHEKPDSRPRARGRKGWKTDDDANQGTPNDLPKQFSKSKGWRQTPLLEVNRTFQPFSTLKRKGRRREEEGWGTEDATDVQELGDFDFEGGLAKFDKNTIFTQLQAEDGTAEEDRLVSLNISSRTRSSSFGVKNLHHSEKVIDKSKSTNGNAKNKTEIWNEILKVTDEDQEICLKGLESTRHIRHMESKLSINRRPHDSRSSSRKNTAKCSLASSRSYSIPRANTGPSFLTVSSGRKCETLSPLQMLNLENIACNELHLSEDVITENAARSIAEVAFSCLKSNSHGSIRSGTSANQTIVVLSGNHKSGLRAVATARHIRNHGFNTIVCVLGIEQESELLAGLKLQIKLFQNFGGRVMSKSELFGFTEQLDTPPDLIIDGLIGITVSFEELRLGDQSTVWELISWANRNKAPVLAIDIPTGIDPTNGEVNIINGKPLYLCPNYIVSLGAPKKGLLEAMALGHGVIQDYDHGESSEWQIYVADIGLGDAIWKKTGAKIRKSVDFEGSWVLKLRFKEATE